MPAQKGDGSQKATPKKKGAKRRLEIAFMLRVKRCIWVPNAHGISLVPEDEGVMCLQRFHSQV